MRVAEKTIELTMCSQMIWPWFPWFRGNNKLSQPIWFGLTQAQEARAGFDAAMKLKSGRLLILQFKAGHRLKSGEVRFWAKHDQLVALQARLGSSRAMYYVLPSVTETSELGPGHPWLVESSWFLDVKQIPALAKPSRKNETHRVGLNTQTGEVIIRSDPVSAQAVKIGALSEESRLGATYERFEDFWSVASLLGKRSVGLAI